MKTTTHARGYLTVHRLRDGHRELIAEDLPNLVLNGGIIGAMLYPGSMRYFAMLAATFPNKTNLEGTWSQDGNIITRTSGEGEFPDDVEYTYGHELKWQDGERCHIITRNSDTQVTVSGPARAITGKTLAYYPTNTRDTGFVQRSYGTLVEETRNTADGTFHYESEVTMAAAPSAYSCGSVVVGTSAARIVFPEPIAVEALDQLQFSYRIEVSISGRSKRTVSLSQMISGWPVEYITPSITGDGTTITVVSTDDHHFEAGDRIVIKDATPARTAISEITASGTAWTVTAPNHGLSATDSVEIEGCLITDYNGAYTIASTPDANTLTITNAAVLGTAANGTVRLTTPATFFNGEFIVASVPDATSLTITSPITGPAVDSATTILTSPDEAEIVIPGGPWGQNSNRNAVMVHDDANAVPEPALTDKKPNLTGLTYAKLGDAYNSPQRDASSYRNDFTDTSSTQNTSADWSAGGADVPRVRTIMLRSVYLTDTSDCSFIWIRLATPQPKLTSHLLRFPNWKQQFIRELD